MSKLVIKCFENFAEIVSASADTSRFLNLKFDGEYEGNLCIGVISASICGSECTLDTVRLPEGVYTPRLVLKDRSVELPKIRKINGVIIPEDYSLTQLRALSIRNGILSERISSLEKRLKLTEEKVFGRGILG